MIIFHFKNSLVYPKNSPNSALQICRAKKWRKQGEPNETRRTEENDPFLSFICYSNYNKRFLVYNFHFSLFSVHLVNNFEGWQILSFAFVPSELDFWGGAFYRMLFEYLRLNIPQWISIITMNFHNCQILSVLPLSDALVFQYFVLPLLLGGKQQIMWGGRRRATCGWFTFNFLPWKEPFRSFIRISCYKHDRALLKLVLVNFFN